MPTSIEPATKANGDEGFTWEAKGKNGEMTGKGEWYPSHFNATRGLQDHARIILGAILDGSIELGLEDGD